MRQASKVLVLIRLVFSRILQTIPVLFAIFTLTFFMVRAAPGGPFSSERSVSPQVMEKLNAHYGLDKNLWDQYWTTLGNIVIHGDLGPSFKYEGRSVNDVIADAIPVSIELGLWAILVAVLIGVPIGVLAAVHRNTWLDYFSMTGAMTGVCLPSFVIGPVLVMIFGLWLHLFNPTGWFEPMDRVLPAFTLGISYAAVIARLTRAGVAETLGRDFVRAARAKGIGGTRLIFVHVLKGGLIPAVAYMGPAVAGILTGSFVVETIFNIPGLGQLFVNGAFGRDFTLVQGTVLLYATLVVLLNLAADLALAWMNPQVRV
jgi:oligopeptide transport system permease protein